MAESDDGRCHPFSGRPLQIKFIVVFMLAGLCTGCLVEAHNARSDSREVEVEPLTFDYFQIELRKGWLHRVEKAHATPGWGERITIEGPDRIGKLQIQSYIAPIAVKINVLRNMTNVDSSIVLTMRRWGDFAGFDYEYVERKVSYRQWWLTNERTMIFITYHRRDDSIDVEIDEIDTIVNSLRIAPADQEPSADEEPPAGALGWEAFNEREKARRQEAWRQGHKHLPGTPSWVPLIDACMEAGGDRNDCIEALPDEEMKKLEAWEQRDRRWRTRSPSSGTFGGHRRVPMPQGSKRTSCLATFGDCPQRIGNLSRERFSKSVMRFDEGGVGIGRHTFLY